MLRSRPLSVNTKQSGESVESVLKKKRKATVGRISRKGSFFSLEWKSEGVMDDESSESMEPMGEVPLVGLGESELERSVLGWQRKAESWFQRRGEAYWKERSVIRREDDVDGRASVTKEEELVLRRGWTVTRLCRYEGWVVVRTL